VGRLQANGFRLVGDDEKVKLILLGSELSHDQAGCLSETNKSKWFANQIDAVLAALPALAAEPVFVSVTIGANDLGWSDAKTFIDLMYKKTDQDFQKTVKTVATNPKRGASERDS
jgi:lysophospholipase L1-like esterase